MVANNFLSFRMLKSKSPHDSSPEHDPSTDTSRPSHQQPNYPELNAATGTLSCRINSRRELRKIFSKFDRNGDGKISLLELESMLRACGDPTDAAEMIRAVDADGDGCIEFEEFLSVIEAETDEERCLEELRCAFAVYDRNGDGVITAKELHHVMRKVMGERTTMADCRRMIRAVDTNGDGAVSFDEFVGMMTRPISSR